MAPQTATRLTYEEFMALPEEEGKHYELIEGELIVNPAPLLRHQRILGNLYFAIRTYFESSGGGEVFVSPLDVVLSGETIVEPDLFIIRSERAPLLGEKNIQGAPDIAIEILSEGTRRRDIVVKRRLYEQFGVDEYWIVDPEIDAIQIYRRRGKAFERAAELETGDTLTSPLLPGFALPLEKVFKD